MRSDEQDTNKGARMASSAMPMPFSPVTLASKLLPAGLRKLATILPALPLRPCHLDNVVPAALISAHFAAMLEVARHMRWLVPPTELNGRSFAITVEDLNLRCCFTCRHGRFRPLWHTASHPENIDLEIGASLGDFLSLAQGTIDADTLFFRRRLKISGDTDLGLIAKNWLDAKERPAWVSGGLMPNE